MSEHAPIPKEAAIAGPIASPAGGAPEPRRVWAFASGALGDTISHWPLYRAMLRRGIELTLVGQKEKVALAAAEIPRTGALGADGRRPDGAGQIYARDVERSEFVRLWQGRCDAADIQPDVDLVITPHDAPEFRRGLALMFPNAEIAVHVTSGYAEDSALWRRFDVGRLGEPTVVSGGSVFGGERAPITIHLGAGSAAKRWPLTHFLELRRHLEQECAGERGGERAGEPAVGERDGARGQGGWEPRAGAGTGGQAGARPIRFIYGEVEREQFTAAERRTLGELVDDSPPPGGAGAGHRGGFVAELSVLADLIRESAVFVGADSGPTHLAAQMGVSTVGLYCAEQSTSWHARGPRVQILTAAAGPAGSKVAGIAPEVVAAAIRRAMEGQRPSTEQHR